MAGRVETPFHAAGRRRLSGCRAARATKTRKPVATFSDPGPGRITEEQWRDRLAKSSPSMMKNNILRSVCTRVFSRLQGTA